MTAIVGEDATHLRGCEQHVPRALGFEELANSHGIDQFELGAGAQHKILVGSRAECPHQRRVDESSVSCDVDLGGFFHASRAVD